MGQVPPKPGGIGESSNGKGQVQASGGIYAPALVNLLQGELKRYVEPAAEGANLAQIIGESRFIFQILLFVGVNIVL